VVVVHRGKDAEKCSSKLGVPNTIRISCEGKEWEDRGDTDKLEESIKENQSQNSKKSYPAVGESKPVTADEKLEKRGEHEIRLLD
jgi:hypothetical protein